MACDLSAFASCVRLDNDGIWYAAEQEDVSYPSEGNDQCFEIEDKSFWFQHRNACIVELVKKFPPHGNGPIFDVGGGNGFVAKGLMDAGWDVVLVEPGPAGARNAKTRGVRDVVCATTQSAEFKPGSMPAIGVFDVVEHIEDDVAFLRHLHDLLEPGGMLYLTVPAYQFLWSHEDTHAGHFRRYNAKTLRERVERAGFEVRLVSGMFTWLIVPVALFRCLPFHFFGRGKKGVRRAEESKADHSIPEWLAQLVKAPHLWERARICESRPIGFGASLICAAELKDS